MAATRLYIRTNPNDRIIERSNIYQVIYDWDGQEYESIQAVEGDNLLVCLEMFTRDGTDAEVAISLAGATAARCIIRAGRNTTSRIYGFQDSYNQQAVGAIENLGSGLITWLFNVGYLRYAITDVNTGTKTFKVAGNYTAQFADNDDFTIDGSTGNDGAYTINGTPTYDSASNKTSIIVDQTPASAVADGDILHNALQNATYTNGNLTAYIECSWIDAANNEQTLLSATPIYILAQLEDTVVGIDAGYAPTYLTATEADDKYLAQALEYVFSTTTTAADPGAGILRFNHATPASVTAIYIDDSPNNIANLDLSTMFAEVTGNRILIVQKNDRTRFLFGLVTADADSTGYYTLTITIEDSGSLPADGADLAVLIFPGDGALSAYVLKSLYDAYSILYADTDNTPAALTISAQSLPVRAAAGIVSATIADGNFVGRPVGGNLGTMTAAQAKTILALAASEITNTPAGSIAATDVQTALNELDTEKLALSGGTMSGNIAMGGYDLTGLGELAFGAATELTIAADAVTLTQGSHKLQPQSGTADDLSTISGLSADEIAIIRCTDYGTDTITLKHNVGNILCVGAADIALSYGAVLLIGDGTKVYAIGGGGGGGGLANVVEDVTPQLGGFLDCNSKGIHLAKGADLASSTNPALGATTDGNYRDITGTTTIAGFDTCAAGITHVVHFTGILTLTYNATSFILPTSANIVTAAGDTAEFVSLGGGNWRCVWYARRSGASLVGGTGVPGTNNIWLSASSAVPAATSGSAPATQESATYDFNEDVLLFDGAAEEYADFIGVWPSNYDGGTVTVKLTWDGASGASAADTVEWECAIRTYSNDDSLDQDVGTAQVISDALLAVGDEHVCTTPAITSAGTPAAGKRFRLRVSRNVGGTDDMTEDAKLKMLDISYSATSAGDVAGPGSSTDNAVARFDGTGGKTIQNSGVIVDDSNNVTGMATLTLTNTGLHLLDTNASHDLIIAPGSDVTADRTLTITTGDADRTLTLSANLTVESASLVNQDLTSDATPTFTAIEIGATDTTLARSGAGDLTIEGNAIYRAGGTDVALADGGTGTSLTDPNADRIMAWDDSAAVVKFMPVADFTDEAAPATGDYVLGYTAEGALVKINWSEISGLVGAGSAPTTLWVPASAMVPRATNGPAPATEEYATNDVNVDYLLFDGATQEYADFWIIMPDTWNAGSVEARFFWDASTGASVADGVVWALMGYSYDNDRAIDAATSAPVDIADAVLAVGDMHISGLTTSALTISNTPAVGEPIRFTATRETGDASDDMTEDAKLFGVLIVFTNS